MAEKLKWHTEKRKVKNLKFYEKNPRKMSDDDKKELSKSIDRFNLVEIPAINTDNMLVAGHQRIDDLLSKGRGDEEIDVRVPNRPLTKKEFREYNIRSNKNHGEFDNDILRKDFTLEELEFFGFDIKETEKLSELKYDPLYYEPENKPDIRLDDCIDLTKYIEKMNALNEYKISDEMKEILKFFAYRFIKIDFENVANFYYFNASEEEKKAIERLRLVLTDNGIGGFIEDDLLKVYETLTDEIIEDEDD